MEEFLSHPAVQAGVAPFVAGLVVMALFHRVHLGGLAVVAGFASAVWLINGFTFVPLTATRKIVLLVLAAPVVGMVIDFAFKPTRLGAWILGFAGALSALWVFFPVLSQKPLMEALIPGATAVVLCGWLTGFMQAGLAGQPVRAGSAGLALGLGAGGASILGASALFGQYGIAVGAGSGAFLLVLMILNRKHAAGSTLVLPVALACGLLASGTVILAQLQWYAALILALVPLAVRIPGPERAGVWLQAIVYSLYGFVVVAGSFAVAWYASRGVPG
ncbi:MAG: hypothetical protein EXR27_21450 [Betaproteobacteria bacterium]|nr:hypothetical protein [Betaproteobacteria bacterium]